MSTENDYFWWGIIAAAFFAGHQAVECHMDNPEHARHLFEAYEQGELLGEGAERVRRARPAHGRALRAQGHGQAPHGRRRLPE
ncbi:unnamed protein product, partial [Heterosigma akashiwo]